MVYEKFIKKGGKVYGPYIYHSRRVDGKVVSEYQGSKKSFFKKFNFNSEKVKKIIILFLGICFLIFMVYFLIHLEKKSISGLTILELIYSEDNQTVLVQDQQGNNIVSLQFLNSLKSIVSDRIIEVKIKSYLPYNLNFTLDDITYYHKNGEVSNIFEEVDVKEKIINNEEWKIISQFELLAVEEKILKIDFSKLNLILPRKENISLEYDNQKITFSLDDLTEGKISVEITTIDETLSIQEENEIKIESANLSLTEEEKEILLEEFGTLNVEIIRQVVKDNVLIIGFEYGDSKEEHYYDYLLSEEIIKSRVEKDKIKLLKQRANVLLEKKNNSEMQVNII